MNIQDVKGHYGTLLEAAKKTGMTPQSFFGWQRNGGLIPYPSQCVIQVESEGELIAERGK